MIAGQMHCHIRPNFRCQSPPPVTLAPPRRTILLLYTLDVMARAVGITARWKDVVRHYIQSRKFVADVISVLPIEMPCFLGLDLCDAKLIAILKFVQLIKFYKVGYTLLPYVRRRNVM